MHFLLGLGVAGPGSMGDMPPSTQVDGASSGVVVFLGRRPLGFWVAGPSVVGVSWGRLSGAAGVGVASVDGCSILMAILLMPKSRTD